MRWWTRPSAPLLCPLSGFPTCLLLLGRQYRPHLPASIRSPLSLEVWTPEQNAGVVGDMTRKYKACMFMTCVSVHGIELSNRGSPKKGTIERSVRLSHESAELRPYPPFKLRVDPTRSAPHRLVDGKYLAMTCALPEMNRNSTMPMQ